jgi:predicted N-acetyltransferase YhbS
VNPLRVVVLPDGLDRTDFSCGTPALDRYFHEHVTQDIRRRVTGCFVALTDENEIGGYYTLAAASVPLTDLPEAQRKRLPRYPSVPAVMMGRLAVDVRFARNGLGGALLFDALIRARDSEIKAFAMLVDAIDTTAAQFYAHHGFVALPDEDRRMVLPLGRVTASLER